MATANDYLYGTWKAMHRRCYDSEYHSFHRYGGRGISVCPRWHTYADFKEDMIDSWSIGMTLDRRENDSNYTPDNCRWLPKGKNVKSLLVEPLDLLELYESGYQQKELAEMFVTDQPHISRILKRARNVR